ncbi:MAG: DEAD/DEAH box helicase [Polyangiaceae bacterium]
MTTDTSPSTDEAKPKTFDDLPLSDELRRALSDMDYDTPTPVQAAVFESASGGRDLVVQARTGTGKTTAFGLPIVDRLVSAGSKRVQAMILCPTRELALQVSRELDRLCAHKPLKITAIYGGAPIGRQIDALKDGTQIVVGTPGRVLDHLRRKTMDPSGIKALVLDESDEMLSMGFERELTAIIEHLPERRQTLLFSATVPPDIERMARSKLRDAEFVILSGDHVGALEIQHFLYRVSQDKPGAMSQIIDIEDPESAIVFCNTKVQTEQLAEHLRREGYESDWLNGDLPQADREKVMRATREGRLRFLVATDVAARGIDISHLTHVINYDFPNDAESYVHRTGRTGRAGNTGTAISLVTPQDIGAAYLLRLTYKIRPIERQLPSDREQRTRWEADVVGALADTFAARGSAEAHRALARRLLVHDDAEAVVAGMLSAHLDTNPELPELAQSRRRGRGPAPVQDGEAKSDERSKRKKGRKNEDGRRRAKDDGPRPPAETKAVAAKATSPEPAGDDGPKTKSRDEGAPEGEDKPRRRRRRKRAESADGEEAREDATAAKASSTGSAKPTAKKAAAKDEGESDGDAPKKRAKKRKKSKDAERADGDGAAEDRPSRKAAKSSKGGRKSSKGAPPEEAVPDSDDGPAPGLTELHLDVGRRDGTRVRTIKSLLADAGIGPEQVHRVRVRDRYCFVEIDDAVVESALEVLDGADLGDRKLKAQISQRSK